MHTDGSPDAAWRAGPLLAPAGPRLNHQHYSLQNTSIRVGVVLLDRNVTAAVLHQLTEAIKISRTKNPKEVSLWQFLFSFKLISLLFLFAQKKSWMHVKPQEHLTTA